MECLWVNLPVHRGALQAPMSHPTDREALMLTTAHPFRALALTPYGPVGDEASNMPVYLWWAPKSAPTVGEYVTVSVSVSYIQL